MNVLIEVVVGLAMIYFVTAMLSSSVMEIVARRFSVRGKMMHEALNRLVPDRWIHLRLINHPMVSGLFRLRPGEGDPPSYLPARNFSIALIDTILSYEAKRASAKPGLANDDEDIENQDSAENQDQESAENQRASQGKLDHLRSAILVAKKDGLNIGDALELVIEAAPDIGTASNEIEKWYESGMQRASGWYKRYAQTRLFVIGLITAVVFNIDSLQITSSLTQSSTLRASVTASAVRMAQQESEAKPGQATFDPYAELEKHQQAGLPIGYACLGRFKGLAEQGEASRSQQSSRFSVCWGEVANSLNEDLLLKCLGWLLTAFAVSFGAPFWFDAMKKLVNLRIAGAKPDEPPRTPEARSHG